MPVDDGSVRALVVQLARLGDLVQSLPAIAALRAQLHIGTMDLLCAVPISPLGACMLGIDHVLPWDAQRWQTWAKRWPHDRRTIIDEIEAYLKTVLITPYDLAFNLNQHARAILTSALFCERVVGPGECGPLSEALPPWAVYLRDVVKNRRDNRVHLADVFCGLCGVMPTGHAPQLRLPETELPSNMVSIGLNGGLWVAVVVGAGDIERALPVSVWRDWVRSFLSESPAGHIVLIGSHTDQERAQAIQQGLSSLNLARVWDCTGQTSLIQTAVLLARCGWVVGSDTGPLHLGCAVGARAMGFYFARARVHETGPYGDGHWTWQAHTPNHQDCHADVNRIIRWPIEESIRLVVEGISTECEGWTLWKSCLDQWGAYFLTQAGASDGRESREDVWRRVHRPRPIKVNAHEYV